ncbi:MAG: hypothetical protein LQ350_007584 [Teloschistes chrysophthalmus]|nr:MAG: hypothetical protein LQ350_007584 [Niorma chrysophthalma]
MALMINMLGYFLGHYPQHFELSDEQRNLILQTMMFFIWLAGGAGVFTRLDSGWQYVDALYFCDVTILTVGFGDFHPLNDTSRGLIFPYSVGGIVILGLMVSSIRKFAQEISHDNIVKRHVEKRRARTIDRSVSNAVELEERQDAEKIKEYRHRLPSNRHLRTGMKQLRRIASQKQKLILLQEEKDRFDAMRNIQQSTSKFKKYSALAMSVIAFGLLWCVGAVGFWQAEQKSQGLSYFQALYFCYVSLLTIGYGDLSPSSNAGKPFFIVWSLVAVPTMTILISDMGDTVIASFKRGTFTLADWTVLPKAGVWRALLERHPRIWDWLQRKVAEAEKEKRVAEGFPIGPVDEDRDAPPPTLKDIAGLDRLDEQALARKLGLAIRRIANDLSADPPRMYTYEEWAEYTRLIRFSRMSPAELDEEEEEQGLIEWDWIGEDSPMMAEKCESEWLLDRLCESLDRYMRMHTQHHKKGRTGRSRRRSKVHFSQAYTKPQHLE